MKSVQLTTESGDTSALLWEPTATDTRASVVVVHEWWGLNDAITRVAQRFCDAGFSVIAVDLYEGAVTDDANTALQLAVKMKTLNATTIIESAATYLKQRQRGHGHGHGKVGVVGFCLGGGVTLASACHCPSASAFVPFYGLPMAKYVDWSKTLGPIQGHYALHDRLVDVERVRAAVDQVNQQGGAFELHVYDAQHAFMRADDPQVFNADAATLAWQRTMDFFERHLS